MTAFAFAFVAWSDDSYEHGQEHLGFERKIGRKVFEQQKDDTHEPEREGEREGACGWGRKEADEQGAKVGAQDEDELGMLGSIEVSASSKIEEKMDGPI